MNDYQEMEKITKALASEIRIQILDLIQNGINSAVEIADKINRHRSSIDRHLKILAEANIIKKVATKTEQEKIVIVYALKKNANVLLATLKHLAKE
jgi:DNA-binding transcriptional ArsR family regulator